MPTFSLGRLGRFQISRLPPSHTSRSSPPTKHHNLPSSPPTKHHTLPSSPPPEYTDTVDIETKYHAPSQAQPPECKTEQVRRYLIEIVAITFKVNFDKLNAALYDIPVPSGTNTILCDSERADLLAKSSLVRKVHGHFLRNEKTMIDRKDEEKICATITRPVKKLYEWDSTVLYYSLEMIGWYGEEVRWPSGTRWASTLPGWWEKNPYMTGDKEQVKYCMEGFWNIINYTALNDRVHGVLWEALDDYRRRCDLSQLDPPKICWPFREEYLKMGEWLKQMTPSEP